MKILLIILIIKINLIFSWKYQTKCTRQHVSSYDSSQNENEYNSVIEDFERDIIIEQPEKINSNKYMRLKCPNLNDFLFIGQTQYGVSTNPQTGDNCKPFQSDCVVQVDYIANQCNGLNSCDIQLDSQFLHTCKNNSDYITIAYECIPGSQKIDICSNDETFIIDSSLSNGISNKNSMSRFNAFYLTSPNYPNEYANNLDNCSCKLEYVKIDSNAEQNLDENKKIEMNLVFNSYEFDLEDSESDKCDKDSFKIKSDKSQQSVCGQYKNFKEFYSTGSKFSLEFQTDDLITRRGFLIKVSTQTKTMCPFDSKRFSAKKCIKLFGDDEKNSYKLNWFEASKSCESLNGRLVSVSDFVDDLRLSTFLNEDTKYWSKRQNESKCFSKKLNTWSEESCVEKNAFVCEFDPLTPKENENNRNGLSDNSGNRLIRVACGSASSIFSSSFRSTETTSKRPIKSNSITNTQKPSTQRTKTTSRILPTITDKSILNIQDIDDMTSTFKIALKSTQNQKLETLFSQDLVLIIAIACGVSIVLIAINIFCLWNYVSKKLKKYYEGKNNLTIDQQTYRSSTNKSTNRTLTSSVDSYAKVPAFDIEHMSACESLSSSGSELGYNTNKPSHQQQQQQHFYETLNKKQQWVNYAEYQPINRLTHFDSLVMMPNGNVNSHYMSAMCSLPINPTVVLLKQIQASNNQQQQIKLDDQEQYSCVVYGELSPAPSNGSNQPLITFSSNSSGVSAI